MYNLTGSLHVAVIFAKKTFSELKNPFETERLTYKDKVLTEFKQRESRLTSSLNKTLNFIMGY